MTAAHSLTGSELSRRFHEEAVRPLLLARWPRLPYAAGRLGHGSEVLGLDDAMSRDHDWGPRLSLFVPDELRGPVDAALEADLPTEFLGLPTRFTFTGSSRTRHRVDVDTPRGFVLDRLGFDPVDDPGPVDWLSLTGQAVLEVIAGPVFVDRTGELTRRRDALAWYPDDIWRYIVAAGWQRLDQELPLMSRAADRGDETGSRLIAARLAGVVTHLAFVLSKRWAPYSKWRGTLFDRLPGVEPLRTHVDAMLDADAWPERQSACARALDALLDRQESAGLGRPAPRATAAFWDRPYLQIAPEIIPALAAERSSAEPTCAVPTRPTGPSGPGGPTVPTLPAGVGSVEQLTDTVDLLVDPARRRAVVAAAVAAGQIFVTPSMTPREPTRHH